MDLAAFDPFAFPEPTSAGDVAPCAPSRAAAKDLGALVIDDPAARSPPRFLRDFARAPVSVLVLGETGAGKEVLASRIHELSGRTGPLVAINCAALAETLLESELFGHEQGAFTGATTAKAGLLEAARGGTVFLDEIGELSAALQPKLLRAIEAREVRRVGAVRAVPIDVRFVAATNCELVDEVAARRFRADLYYRLDGVTVRLAPLRARPERIVPLARQFIAAALQAMGSQRPPVLTAALRARLESHSWPGNVRELKAACERAVVLARDGVVDARHLVLAPPAIAPVATAPTAAPGLAAAGTLTDAQAEERNRIVATLAACAGNQRRAATALGISRATLATRLVLYRIPRPRDR